MTLQRIISSSLSPNTQAADVREAIHVLLNPVSWQEGSAIHEVEQWFMHHLGTSSAISFDSGRSALSAILQAFDIGQGDEVMLQAFTCVAVPNAIGRVGAIPVYVDIDESFNIDPKNLERKITKRAKVIIVQHSFGVPAQTDAILACAKKHRLIIIEDCAHSLGAKYKGRKIGTLGDAAFFSFGRDKVVSSVWGGMATVSEKRKVQSKKLREYQKKLPMPSMSWIVQQLLHPIAFAAILPTYNIVVGKVLLEMLKRTHLLSLPFDDLLPRRYPNGLARLLLKQLSKLEEYNDRRRNVASYYHHVLQSRTLDKEAIYLRFPMLVDDPVRVVKHAKQQGILLGNWYHNIIDPKGVDLRAVGYQAGSCPRAEESASRIVNLPTLVTREEANEVVCNLTG